MKRNNKGMTLVELLVAITIMSVVIGVLYSVYIGNTKIISKTEIKNMLQTEGQYIQQAISHIGMQSEGIYNIEATKTNDDGDFNLIQMDMKISKDSKDEKKQEYDLYRIKIDNSDIENEKNKVLKLQKLDKDTLNITSENILSKNIYECKIRPIPKTVELSEVVESKAIDIYIKLSKQKGFTNEEYDISTLIKFRNKK